MPEASKKLSEQFTPEESEGPPGTIRVVGLEDPPSHWGYRKCLFFVGLEDFRKTGPGVFFCCEKMGPKKLMGVDTAVDTQDVPGGYTPNVWGDPF